MKNISATNPFGANIGIAEADFLCHISRIKTVIMIDDVMLL